MGKKKRDLGVGMTPCTWERGLLPTRSLGDRNETSTSKPLNDTETTGGGWELGGQMETRSIIPACDGSVVQAGRCP